MKFWNGSKSYKRSNLENLCLMACGCNKYSGVATKKAPSLKPAHYWGMATIRDRKVYPMRPNAMCCAIWVKCCTFHFLWSSCTKSASVWPTYVRNQNRKYSKNHIDECETKISPNVIEWILFLFFSFFSLCVFALSMILYAIKCMCSQVLNGVLIFVTRSATQPQIVRWIMTCIRNKNGETIVLVIQRQPIKYDKQKLWLRDVINGNASVSKTRNRKKLSANQWMKCQQ